MRFNNIAQDPQAENLLHYLGGGFLSENEYFGSGRELADASSDLDSIQGWKANIQHDQVRLELFGFANCFQSV